jgi:hypothetical protein
MRYLIGIIIDLIFAFACSRIASSKGRGPVLWGILGFFFSLITLIVVLIVPRRHWGNDGLPGLVPESGADRPSRSRRRAGSDRLYSSLVSGRPVCKTSGGAREGEHDHVCRLF